ncbi:hypothetical protein VUR80DRAFT_7719 [Thermomyces stellatus]
MSRGSALSTIEENSVNHEHSGTGRRPILMVRFVLLPELGFPALFANTYFRRARIGLLNFRLFHYSQNTPTAIHHPSLKMLRFHRSPPEGRPSSPLLPGRSSNKASSSASTPCQISSESLAESLTDSIANSNAYSIISAPRSPTVPLSTLIHPLRYLASSLYARVYELPRRQPRILKVC